MFQVSARPAPSQPTGRLPDALSMRSIVARIGVALLRRVHLGQPQRVGLVVADQLPAEPEGFLDDLRVMIADLAVERGAGADAVRVRTSMIRQMPTRLP